ncbi:hypothetical protein [Flavobacterium sp. DG2-3]|mgnify:CR=1 FL=1|uniref:hypothetical protein n=1 Tax=Flavobacterium sp. DG2-3 TaxID=3068317 RepID=UPI00273DAF6A|nr:hypothetical protein [Flavobacterium sp. DG2-3]MDP5200353.1 hypothetical protein [Flavobacterium sp. DG2-3]
MTPENCYHSVPQDGAAACYEEQLLLQYHHCLGTGISALAKAKSRFNTLLVGARLQTGEGSPDEQEEQSEQQQQEETASDPGTFLM